MAAGNTPSIVAIIPLYNGAAFIEQAVRSICDQTRPPEECIVVDDGSSDEGPEIVARLSRELPVRLLRKSNDGQSSARNYGVARSTSNLIAFLDQDDFWYPDHLAKLVAPFEARPGDGTLGWVYSDLDEGDETGRLLTRNFLRTRKARHPKTSVAECLKDDMFVLPSASLVARHAFEAVDGYDERLSGYEDDDLFIRMLDQGFDNIFVDEALSLWRIYAFSTSYSPRMARSRMIFARKALELFGNRRDDRGDRVSRSAIAPRFFRALLGEYARAGRRGDLAAMDSALGDIQNVIAPQFGYPAALAIRSLTILLHYHPLGRLLAGGRFGIARRLFRWPVDHRAAALEAQADQSRD